MPNGSLFDSRLEMPTPETMLRWQDLARRALAPAGHNAPEAVIPALALASGTRLLAANDASGLQAALPVTERRWPVRIYTNATTPLHFHSLPHLDAGVGRAVAGSLLRRLAAPLLLRSVPLENPVTDALIAGASHVAVLGEWERAALRPDGHFADWFESNFDRPRRKELRRLRRRLSEQGRLTARSLQPTEAAEPWADAFMALEAAGWKGRRGTATASDSRVASAFRAAVSGLHLAAKLRFWRLDLDETPVAMLWAVVERDQAWLGKIAHDERFARFSPGVLMILEATESLFGENIALRRFLRHAGPSDDRSAVARPAQGGRPHAGLWRSLDRCIPPGGHG